ncbi:DUF7006 family protein [Enterococcus sp. DIV0213h]|uniref:DUF7006 family protein n=1 Tax=Enterococcus sp. DIV0213h TaxID=2774669 RepID=UPI003F29C13D
MLAKKISEPNDYLAYSKKVLTTSGILVTYPKLAVYYFELCRAFNSVYKDRSKPFFDQMSALLSIDAQIQILLDLTETTRTDLCQEIGMNEEEVISMIRNDHKYYYRELTGVSRNQDPRWCLIYLSEE